MFKRGIKHDPLSYPVLKEKLWNDNRNRFIVNQARAQDVSDVLDPTYLPITPTDVYAILEYKVETAKGKAIIHKHEGTFDAQRKIS
jgi:hypothetical protein